MNLINNVRTLTADSHALLTFDLLLYTTDDDSTELLATRFAASVTAQYTNNPEKV
jgi:hypothetical protein